jgi:hypothetical protein
MKTTEGKSRCHYRCRCCCYTRLLVQFYGTISLFSLSDHKEFYFLNHLPVRPRAVKRWQNRGMAAKGQSRCHTHCRCHCYGRHPKNTRFRICLPLLGIQRKIVHSSCPVHAWTTYILNALLVQWGYGDDQEDSTHGAGCHVGCIGSCMLGWFVSIGN